MNNSKYSQNRELCRLLSAAVINKEFCNLLLTDAELALTAGYRGETFNLSPREKNLVLSIQASSLQDFAQQLTNQQNGLAVNTHINSGSHARPTHKNGYL